jgi:hypothetical protein
MSKVADKLGIPSDWCGWTGRKEFRGHGLPRNPRLLGLLNMGWARHLQQMPGVSEAVAAQNYFCDVSQGVERLPVGKLGTMLQGSYKYSFAHDRVLSGADNLATLGFPLSTLAQTEGHLSDRDLRSLAGEAFSLPDITTAVFAFWTNRHAPWWRQEAGEGRWAIRSAMNEPHPLFGRFEAL